MDAQIKNAPGLPTKRTIYFLTCMNPGITKPDITEKWIKAINSFPIAKITVTINYES